MRTSTDNHELLPYYYYSQGAHSIMLPPQYALECYHPSHPNHALIRTTLSTLKQEVISEYIITTTQMGLNRESKIHTTLLTSGMENYGKT